MRVNQRKMGIILANGRKMSKYAEIQVLKVKFRYAILRVIQKFLYWERVFCNPF